MVSRHHIRLIQVSNFLDLNIYAKTPWGPRVCTQRAGILVIVLLVEKNSKLLLRKIFFEIFLVQSDLMNKNYKKWFSPPREPLTTFVSFQK